MDWDKKQQKFQKQALYSSKTIRQTMKPTMYKLYFHFVFLSNINILNKHKILRSGKMTSIKTYNTDGETIKQKRKRILQKLADFWIYLSDNSFKKSVKNNTVIKNSKQEIQ